MQGELLYEIKARFTSITVKGQEGAGLRMDLNLTGEVAGKINGSLLETHNVTIFPDGSGIGTGQGIITTKEGDTILTQGSGVGRATEPGVFSVRIAPILKTTSPRLAAFNNIMGIAEATTDLNKQEFTARVFELK